MLEDREGKKFAGIDLAWNYTPHHEDRTCRLSMDGYIATILFKEGHEALSKAQLLPHRHCKIVYGAKAKLAPQEDGSPPFGQQWSHPRPANHWRAAILRTSR